MDFSDSLECANENPVTPIMTVEGDQPRVRAFVLRFADQTGFHSPAGTPGSVYGQLPEGELWFHSPGEGAGRMMRVTGTVEFVTGKAPERRFLWIGRGLQTSSKQPGKMTGLRCPGSHWGKHGSGLWHRICGNRRRRG